MSGIYIKGMEMPKNCSECAFCGYYGNGEHMCDIRDKAVEYESAKTSRRDDCPLIPVPDHGRLIDADALREDWLENGENEYVYDTNAFLDSLDDAPTIIPAEEGQT